MITDGISTFHYLKCSLADNDDDDNEYIVDERAGCSRVRSLFFSFFLSRAASERKRETLVANQSSRADYGACGVTIMLHHANFAH